MVFRLAHLPAFLVNSLGISLAKESSSIGGHVMVIIKRGDDVGSFYDFDSARVMDDFNPSASARAQQNRH